VSFVTWLPSDADERMVIHINLPSFGWNGSWSSMTAGKIRYSASTKNGRMSTYLLDVSRGTPIVTYYLPDAIRHWRRYGYHIVLFVRLARRLTGHAQHSLQASYDCSRLYSIVTTFAHRRSKSPSVLKADRYRGTDRTICHDVLKYFLWNNAPFTGWTFRDNWPSPDRWRPFLLRW